MSSKRIFSQYLLPDNSQNMEQNNNNNKKQKITDGKVDFSILNNNLLSLDRAVRKVEDLKNDRRVLLERLAGVEEALSTAKEDEEDMKNALKYSPFITNLFDKDTRKQIKEKKTKDREILIPFEDTNPVDNLFVDDTMILFTSCSPEL